MVLAIIDGDAEIISAELMHEINKELRDTIVKSLEVPKNKVDIISQGVGLIDQHLCFMNPDLQIAIFPEDKKFREMKNERLKRIVRDIEFIIIRHSRGPSDIKGYVSLVFDSKACSVKQLFEYKLKKFQDTNI